MNNLSVAKSEEASAEVSENYTQPVFGKNCLQNTIACKECTIEAKVTGE